MTRKECPNKMENIANCPCDSISCERKGVCCECINYHRKNGDKPACMED